MSQYASAVRFFRALPLRFLNGPRKGEKISTMRDKSMIRFTPAALAELGFGLAASGSRAARLYLTAG